jgi:hypothetical protein
MCFLVGILMLLSPGITFWILPPVSVLGIVVAGLALSIFGLFGD